MNMWIRALVLLAGALVYSAQSADWETDYPKALARARQENKFVLLDFSGSDWCGWCKKLDREIFSQSEFDGYAKDFLVCVSIDFPRRIPQSDSLRVQNAELHNKYGVSGFPTIVLLDPAGQEVGRTGYQSVGAAKYVQHLEELLQAHRTYHPAAASAQARTGNAEIGPTPKGSPVIAERARLSLDDRPFRPVVDR